MDTPSPRRAPLDPGGDVLGHGEVLERHPAWVEHVHGHEGLLPGRVDEGVVGRVVGPVVGKLRQRHLGQDNVVAEAASSPGPFAMSVRTLHANWSSRVTGEFSTMLIIVWKSCSGISSDNRTVRCR